MFLSSVDSSEMAFKMAASLAFKKAFMDANPVLLEPIASMKLQYPTNILEMSWVT